MQDNKFKYAYRCHDIIHAMYKVETEIIKKTLFSTTWQKAIKKTQSHTYMHEPKARIHKFSENWKNFNSPHHIKNINAIRIALHIH